MPTDRDILVQISQILSAYLDTPPPPPPPPTGDTIRVAPGDDISQALTSLYQTGGTLLCAPGDYRVTLIRGKEHGNARVTVKTDATLPEFGTRITKDYLPGLARFASDNTFDPVFHGLPGSSNMTFLGVAFMPQHPDRAQVRLGGDRGEMTDAALIPRSYQFDRCLFMGSPNVGQLRGLEANCGDWAVFGSSFHDFFAEMQDCQAIVGWNGCQNGVIDNCYLEAGAENVMFGGADPASPDFDPRNVVLVNSKLTKNIAWKDLPFHATVKTLLELKNLRGFRMENCVLEKNWAYDWPTAAGIVLKCANQEGSNPTACTRDVVIRNVVVRDVGIPLVIVAEQDGGRLPTEWMENVTIDNCLFHRLNVPGSPYCGEAQALQLANLPNKLTINHVTWRRNGHSFMQVWSDNGSKPGPGLVYTNNAVAAGAYGLQYSDYTSFDAMFPISSRTVAGNAIRRGGSNPSIPGFNYIDPDKWDSSFTAENAVRTVSAVGQIPTTDGKPVGADVTALKATVKDW